MEFIRTHARWLMIVILGLTAVAFIAPQGYTGFVDATSSGVATVAGNKITQGEWDSAHRLSSERMRQRDPTLDAKQLETEAARYETLEGVVHQRLIAAAARAQHLEVSNERLEARFMRDPQLAFLRNPDGGLNPTMLASQGMTKDIFIDRLRQDLSGRQALAPVALAGGEAAPATVAMNIAFDALLQRRQVRLQHFDARTYASQIQVSDADVEAFYARPDTQKLWMQPESAQIEYLVLDAEQLKAGLSVAESELRKFYELNASRFGTSEERRASHILLKVEGDEKAVREKAEQLLAQLRKEPARFADLAKQNSQDEGSAANGGDLDFFARGAMVKPFEDAAYALKVGEISGLVRSDFGFHIIKLDAIRGGEVRPFEMVRAEIDSELRAQQARQRYQQLAEVFSTMVFEQPDSLQPTAEKLGIGVQRASVQRKPQVGQQGPLASVKLLDAIFGVESLRSKRNTEAVETAPNQLASARIVKHQPSAVPPLAEVKELVRQQLVMKRGAELAKKAGEARFARGLSGGDEGLQATQWVSRIEPGEVPRSVVEAVLRADASKLPAVVGVDQGSGGYWFVRLENVGARQADAVPAELAARQYAQAWAVAEGRAYLDALKLRHKAEIKAPKPAASAP